MKLKRQDLLNALNAVQAGLAKKEIIEQMAHFIFTGKNLITYNDKTCVYHPLETDFTCSVHARDFISLLSKMSSEVVDLSHKSDKLIIKSKSTTAKLSTIVEDEVSTLLHDLESQIEDKWEDLPEDFLDGLYLCMFSTSKDQTLGTLTCVKAEGNTIASTDSTRISVYEMKKEVPQMYIPASSVPDLRDLLVKKFHVSKSWLHFMNENNVRISIRKIEGNFPDYEKFLNLEGNRVRLPPELKEALEIVCVMAEGDVAIDKRVDITLSEDQLICSSRKDRGSVEKIVPIRYKKDPIKFTTNPVFLSQVLENATRVTIGSYALFESDTFKHVLALSF